MATCAPGPALSQLKRPAQPWASQRAQGSWSHVQQGKLSALTFSRWASTTTGRPPSLALALHSSSITGIVCKPRQLLSMSLH